MAKAKIKDLKPDIRNYNKGNEFGNSLIEKSLRKFGAGRSILLDKNNNVIAGNKTLENASSIGMEDVEIVESDGTKIIAVRRTDIDINTKKGRELALADNASAKANIEFDTDLINQDWSVDEQAEWGVKVDFEINSEDEAEHGISNKFFLNIELNNESELQSWYEKLIKEGLNVKIIT